MSFLPLQDQRNITFWDIVAEGVPRKKGIRYAKPLTIEKLFIELQKFRVKNFSNSECIHEFKSKGISVDLRGITFDSSSVSVLLQIMDEKASRQVFRNRTTRRSRIAEKHDDEVVEYSMHIVISKTAYANRRDSYQCVIEECPVCSALTAVHALNMLLKKAAFMFEKKFLRPHPDGQVIQGKPEMMKTYNRLSLLGHPAESFNDTIREGTLTNLVAVTKFDADLTIDGTDTCIPVAKHLKFSVSNKLVGDNVSYYEKIKNFAFQNNCEVLKIQFKDKDGSPYTLDMDTETGQLVDERKFIKRLVLDGHTKESFTSSMDCFDLELLQNMRRALYGSISTKVGQQISPTLADVS